jgi:hypothetical protein
VAVVNAGATVSQPFSLTTLPVAIAQTVSITAKYWTSIVHANLTVNPVNIVSVNLSPSTVTGGNSVTGTVTISPAAPLGGVTITLSCSSGSSYVILPSPATVYVQSGKTVSNSFTIGTQTVPSSVTATIVASILSLSKSATLKILSP